MRQFLVLGHDAPTDPGINLNDLPGSAGRLDLLCRCVTSGLLHSHGIREESEVRAILQDAVTVRFEGSSIRQLHPDERSTAARFVGALEDAQDAIGHIEVRSSPGISVSRLDLESNLEAIDTPIVQLHPDGEPLADWEPSADVTFVLSDHHPFTEEEERVLSDYGDKRLSIGPVAVHANQAITVVHNYLDTDGYTEYH